MNTVNCTIKQLGGQKYHSPLYDFHVGKRTPFTSDKRRMYLDVTYDHEGSFNPSGITFEVAGPREKLYFDPSKTRSAIVTCGGLCPGLNDVIRSIVMESTYQYGSTSILGVRFGYNGLNPEMGFKPVELTPDIVEDIHNDGGTILGSSRGGTENMDILVNTPEKSKISF